MKFYKESNGTAHHIQYPEDATPKSATEISQEEYLEIIAKSFSDTSTMGSHEGNEPGE